MYNILFIFKVFQEFGTKYLGGLFSFCMSYKGSIDIFLLVQGLGQRKSPWKTEILPLGHSVNLISKNENRGAVSYEKGSGFVGSFFDTIMIAELRLPHSLCKSH
jgi:hypothetical protein